MYREWVGCEMLGFVGEKLLKMGLCGGEFMVECGVWIDEFVLYYCLLV